MPALTRIWSSKSTPNLFTTIPRTVRDQLALTPDDKVAWRLEGSFAELKKAKKREAGSYAVYKQSRSNSLYTVIPQSITDQLKFNERSRAEWELHGDKAHVRRG